MTASANTKLPPLQARVSRVPAVALLIMVITSDLEYRQRDVNAALEGSVDLAILIEIVGYLLVAGLFFLAAKTPRGRRLGPVLTPMWALSGLFVLSSFWAPSPTLSFVRSGQVMILAGMATWMGRRATRFHFALLAHAYIVLMTAFIALGLVWSTPPSGQVAGRFNWAVTHPVVAASLLIVSMLILLSWTREDSGPRIFGGPLVWTLFFIHLGALLATQTRGAVFAGVVGVVTWVVIAVHRRRDVVVLFLLLLPVAIYSGRGVIESFLLRGESAEQLATLNSRTDLWTEAINLIEESPFTGRGYFSARELFLESIGLGGAHNAYVEVLVSAGIIGAVVLLWALVAMVRGINRVAGHPQRAVIAAIFAALLAHGLTAQYWAQGGTGANVWFMLLFGWIAAAERERVDGEALDAGR